MLPPHNVIVEDRPDLGHEALAMLPGEEFDVAFPEAGDYTYWCGPHKGAGMIGTVHVE
jgi:plastocyanin